MKGQLRQVCIATRDAKKTMDELYELFGIGPWEIRYFKPDTVSYFEVDGQELKEGFNFLAAVTELGNGLQLEIVQPIEGPNVYWDVLDRKGDATLHHFKIVYETEEDFRQCIEQMAQKGVKVTQTGTLEEDIHAYLDTEDKLGYIIEIGYEGPLGPAEERYPDIKFDPNRRLPNFTQIGALVPDMEKNMKNFVELFGIGPWAVREFNKENMEYFNVGGKPVEKGTRYLTSVAMAGDVELEFMQPISGDTVYCKDGESYISGLHHMKDVMTNAEIEDKKKELKSKFNIDCLQEGKYKEDIHCYMDTNDKIGFLYEIGNGAEISGEPDYYIPNK